MPVRPLFPLESVLLPSMVLPLQVFEPRYRELVQACLAAEQEFGVVLISRGSEVGGQDQRTDLGTMARIARAAELDDGRWAIVAVGVRRFRVAEWLPDDPFPQAEVVDWPDEDPDPSLLVDAYQQQVANLRRTLALAAELGDPVAPPTVDLTEDPGLGSYQLAALAPIGPLDRHALLAAPTAAERLALVGTMLADEEMVLNTRLAGG